MIRYVGHTSEQKARRLLAMLTGDYPPTLQGWGALRAPRVPNSTPWSHLSRVIDRLLNAVRVEG